MSSLKSEIIDCLSAEQERKNLVSALLSAAVSIMRGAGYAYQEDSATIGDYVYSVWCDAVGDIARFSRLSIKEKDNLKYQLYANENTGRYEKTFQSPAGDVIACAYINSRGDWYFDSDLSNQEIMEVLKDFPGIK